MLAHDRKDIVYSKEAQRLYTQLACSSQHSATIRTIRILFLTVKYV